MRQWQQVLMLWLWHAKGWLEHLQQPHPRMQQQQLNAKQARHTVQQVQPTGRTAGVLSVLASWA
jgi:hypothetical protein